MEPGGSARVWRQTVAEIAYVASHAHNLSFPVDINQVPEDKLGPNDSPSCVPTRSIRASRETLSTVISNYNSLQASISRRFDVRTQPQTQLHLVSLPGRSGFLRLAAPPERRRQNRTILQRAMAPPTSMCAMPSREESSMSCPSAREGCS